MDILIGRGLGQQSLFGAVYSFCSWSYGLFAVLLFFLFLLNDFVDEALSWDGLTLYPPRSKLIPMHRDDPKWGRHFHAQIALLYYDFELISESSSKNCCVRVVHVDYVEIDSFCADLFAFFE